MIVPVDETNLLQAATIHSIASIRSVFTLRILCEQNRFIRNELTTETNIPFSNKAATTGQW